MKIRKVSDYSEVTHEMDLPITLEQIEAYLNGTPVSNAFPQLNEEQKRFMVTGITPREWNFMNLTQKGHYIVNT